MERQLDEGLKKMIMLQSNDAMIYAEQQREANAELFQRIQELRSMRAAHWTDQTNEYARKEEDTERYPDLMSKINRNFGIRKPKVSSIKKREKSKLKHGSRKKSKSVVPSPKEAMKKTIVTDKERDSGDLVLDELVWEVFFTAPNASPEAYREVSQHEWNPDTEEVVGQDVQSFREITTEQGDSGNMDFDVAEI